MAEPDEYHKSTTIKLYFNSKADCSIDEAGAIKYSKSKTKAKANTHGTWVQQAQKDLIALGYLAAKGSDGNPNDDGYFGPGTKRAVSRFQRHAARVYRMDPAKAIQDVKPAEVFAGKETGEVDAATAKEMRKWIDKKWVNPVGRFKFVKLSGKLGGQLREDAAAAWEKIVSTVTVKGGTLEGPYGDTVRTLGYGKKVKKGGTSNYSFHYSGRAVDIRQALADPPEKGRRYYVMSDLVGSDQFWRILCKVEKQDGSQGTLVKKGEKKRWDFPDKKEYGIPEGYYIDLTEEIERSGEFQRIKAHSGWESNTNKSEWWHFQFTKDVQATFSDEIELVGTDEATLRTVKNQDGIVKWPDDSDLDHKPG